MNDRMDYEVNNPVYQDDNEMDYEPEFDLEREREIELED
jgi:hypothetical protein